MTPQDHDQTSNNSAIGALIGYVLDHLGDGAVGELLARAGETRTVSQLQDPAIWSTEEQSERLFEVAEAMTGDPDLPRHVGAQLLVRYSSPEILAVFRSIDDVAVSLRLVAEAASSHSTAQVFTCLEAGDRHAVISAHRVGRPVRSDRMCRFAEGAFSSLPQFLGMPPATVTQSRCMARGDDRCLFEVAWDPAASEDPAVQARFLRVQVDSLTRRFEALEEMATDLATVADVDELLERIVHRAGLAVRAPRYLLAVTLPGEDRPRVHHVGFAPDEVDDAASAILGGDPGQRGTDRGSHLVVDVAVPGATFGRFGASFPPGHRFMPADRRLLAAYAGHAAAALQTAALMADRQRQADTNAALLGLSAALADLSTAAPVALRLAASVPGVIACDRCAVLLCEPGTDDAVIAPPAGGTDGGPVRVPISPATRRRLADGPGRPVPVHALPALRPLADAGTVGPRAVAVPVAAERSLLALILLDWDAAPPSPGAAGGPALGPGAPKPGAAEPDAPGPAALDPAALAGVAGLAATALHNAYLVQQMAYRADHDPLTGLANLRLLEQLATTALANASRRGAPTGVLFLDLDGFKEVNDRLGHAAGDVVLRKAADRVAAAVRAGDTAARIGGDEFVVLLPEVADRGEAEAVAARIRRSIERPIACAAEPVVVRASIGVALSAGGGDFRTLLAAADAAMYRAKVAAGGAGALLDTADR